MTQNTNDSFRDNLATVDKAGKRIWLYPKKPSGYFYKLRSYFSYFLLAFLFFVPFIKIDGHPLFLFNILERRFILFGQSFWPQDFYLFGIGMITFVIFIILFTVVFGRVWCGWACPQTIFMELLYRKVEYWIEGDSAAQRRLNARDWDKDKFFKKVSKHSIFLVFSFIIAHTVLAWLVGIEKVFELITGPPGSQLIGFLTMTASTLIIYGVYARFREQMCTTFCPYGRLQGVLLANDSMVVAYDFSRGEPKGKAKKKAELNLGDCIDCSLCVQVCPTGIDIRNGTQLECVNCTACMDACDSIMEKVDRPKGLIRYASINSIKENVTWVLSGRMKAYIAVLVLLVGFLITLLVIRSDVETTILRTPGTLYQEYGEDKISNLYQLQMVNKTFEDMPITLKAGTENAEIRIMGKTDSLLIPASGTMDAMFFFDLPRSNLYKTKTAVVIEVYSDGKLHEKVKTNFMGPISKANN